MTIIDTNIICSLFDPNDSNHEKATNHFFNIPENEEIRIPFIVASELAIDPASKKFYLGIKAITKKFLPNNETDIEFILDLPMSIKKQLKANDCLILALCQRHHARLLTLDKNLIKALRTVDSSR
ncbi:MAG: PIN domain-containing protein [bacterium]